MSTPGLGAGLMRNGRFTEQLIAHGVGRPLDPAQIRSYVEVLREPERARASSLLYRHFVMREVLGVLAAGTPQVRVPLSILFGTLDLAIDHRMLRGIYKHAPDARVELIRDCGHFIVDEQPELVAARARELFAPARAGAGAR